MSDERREMTPEELDELASAYLDGEATPEEAALVEGDPRLLELVEELRAVRDLVATPVEPPPDEVRDQMIARALDQRAPVVSLETARRRLRSIPPRARVILAAAAVVAAIAMVGVTLFEQTGDDDQFADDSASAPAMADAPADAVPEAPLAPEPQPESAEPAESEEPAEDMAMESAAPMSDDADAATEALPEPIDLMGPAEESAAVAASPESLEDEPADEAPSDDSEEPEPAMADEPAEIVPLSEEAALVFASEADLIVHVVQVAEDLTAAQGTDQADAAARLDLLDCPLTADEKLELLTRFDAVVEGTGSQVSVYLGEGELRFTQTSPPPDCELFNSHTFLDWP